MFDDYKSSNLFSDKEIPEIVNLKDRGKEYNRTLGPDHSLGSIIQDIQMIKEVFFLFRLHQLIVNKLLNILV